MGALLFALGSRISIEYIAEYVAATNTGTEVVFYFDDGYLVVSHDHLLDNLTHFVQAFAAVGMEFNMAKLRICARQPENVLPELHQYMVGNIKCLGTKMSTPG